MDTKSISPLPVSETDSGLDLSAYDRLSGKLCVCEAISFMYDIGSDSSQSSHVVIFFLL